MNDRTKKLGRQKWKTYWKASSAKQQLLRIESVSSKMRSIKTPDNSSRWGKNLKLNEKKKKKLTRELWDDLRGKTQEAL